MNTRCPSLFSKDQLWQAVRGWIFVPIVSLVGCGIPCLRGPEPGPQAPEVYSWNNGQAYWSPTSRKESADDPPQAVSSRKNFVRSVSFSTGDDQTETRAVPAPALLDFQTESAEGETPRLTSDQPAAAMVSTELSSQQAENLLAESQVIESSGQLPHESFYSDPYLLDLIQQAILGNQELKILNEEIQIASNEILEKSGEYRPFVNFGGGAGLDKAGRHTRFGAVEENLEVAPDKAFPDPLPDFLVGADVSWEIDIWNRLRNAQRAATIRFLASQDGQNFVVTRLVAEVASSYFELLALDSRLQNLEQTIAIQMESLRFAEENKKAGRGTELAVQRFQAEVHKNNSEKSVILQEIVEVENRINFLLGRYPQPVKRSDVEFTELSLNTLAAGVPSQLLQQRPDIRQAEQQIEAAGLDVEIARARFYPQLSLTAGLGWNAFSTGYLFRTPESLIYGIASELVGPLINKRAIQAAYMSANAAQLQSIYHYQKTVLTAHIEVVNYITKIENYRRSIETKKDQLASLEASVDAATKLFQNARAEYVEVLLAQRELMEARMQIIGIKREQLSAIVNAYQALGGGGF